MDRTYYVIDYHLDGAASHLIWFTNDSDGVVLDEGRVANFRDLPKLREHAVFLGLSLHPEESLFDFDEIERWLRAPTKTGISCDTFLNAWNLFDDIARSVRDRTFALLSEEPSLVYDKLFWGCNLPAVTPPGEHFDPIWSDEDVESLRRILAEGMAMLRRSLKDIA